MKKRRLYRPLLTVFLCSLAFQTQSQVLTWTTKASLPKQGRALGVAMLNGKIYAIGGQTTGDVPLVSIEEYDPVADTWSLKADMPTARVSYGAVAVNGKIYVVGGRINNTPVAPTYMYDPGANAWTTNAN